MTSPSSTVNWTAKPLSESTCACDSSDVCRSPVRAKTPVVSCCEVVQGPVRVWWSRNVSSVRTYYVGDIKVEEGGSEGMMQTAMAAPAAST